MNSITLLPLLLLSPFPAASAAPQAQVAPQARGSRPQAPYSLEPSPALHGTLAGRSAEGASAWATGSARAAVEVPEDPAADDSIPLPVGPVVQVGADGDLVARQPSGDPHFLGFAAGAYRPGASERVDPQLLVQAQQAGGPGRPHGDTFGFVMFTKRMTPARLARLEALGCRALGFHPHYTQKVALPVGAIEAVAALDFVRWIGVPRPWQKLHPVLSGALEAADPAQPVDLWVSVYESDLGPGSVQRLVSTGERIDAGGAAVPAGPLVLEDVWVRAGWQQDELERAGVGVTDYSDRVRAFRVRALPPQVSALAALDFVQFIELDTLAVTNHDESMAMVNADDMRNFFDGSNNATAIAGIVDSGVELSHQDFLKNASGINLSGSSNSAFDDDCGHGTHVAGSLAGEGNADPSLTGAAPGLGALAANGLKVARIFASCAPQAVDEAAVIGWMESLSERPHVINNSWSTAGSSASPWIGSEVEAQLYDDNAYSAAQLNVFSAGNVGPAGSTIGLQPSAKNVLTVGNVLDYDDFFEGSAGELAMLSSRGPTGDGRWKPNLVAPGKWVESCDAFDFDGYTLMNGTSMAAPHVTGVASGLIDSDGSFAFLPEKISAHLMATATRKNNAVISIPSDAHLDQYGAGRVDATSAIWDTSAGTSTDWAFSLAAGSSTSGDFDVPAGATRVVVVMHYVEPSASSGASTALVNDWDLWVDQPPLTAGNNTGEWFAQQSAIDNTEMRVFSSPITGTWRWKIWPESTTTTTYFGVTVYVEFGDLTPSILPNLNASATVVQPNEVVQFDYTAATSGTPLSALKLELDADGASLASAGTLLKDGVWTDLLDNQASGFEVMLGNIHPLFSRSARWQASWASEGFKTFAIDASADNAGNFGQTSTSSATITVDGTGPTNVSGLTSTSHTPNVWTNDVSIDMTWGAAFDGLSGLAGYSHTVATSPGAPPTTQTLGPVTSHTVTTFIGNGAYYNLRAVDNAGNWSPFSAWAGPYLIDVIAPTQPSSVNSTSHAVNVLSCSTQLDFTWSAATDFDSGIAGYALVVDTSPSTTPSTAVTTALLSYTANVSAAPASWYLHIRAVDVAGNGGSTVHLGPFPVDPDPVSIYCSAKVNSQGCTPTVSTSGQPSAGAGGLTVAATNVLNNKTGLLFWGTNAASNPFQGGTKCVANPVKRTTLQDSGGNPPPDDCSGVYKFTFDGAYMNAQGIVPGDTLYAQFWSRDPSAPFTTGLTDAVKFTVCQ